jgi:RimJ/RimL family protein N-acetyltransferase
MSEFTQRVLTVDDAEAFKTLRREVVEVSPIGMGTTLEEELSRPITFFESELSFEEPSRAFGIFYDGKLVSSSAIRWPSKHASARHVTILYGVQTAPNFRRQSLSRRLVRETIQYAFSNSSRRIYLYVYQPNPEAVSLYESLGFIATGSEPEVLKLAGRYHDLLFMSLGNPLPDADIEE